MSTLLEIRTQFVKISGRYDLITGSFIDAGADYYIQQGQRYLERKLNITPAIAKIYQDLTVLGTYLVKFKNCRAIWDVWIMDSGSRTQLIKLEEPDLKAFSAEMVGNMYTTPLSSADRGRPVYYFPTNFRRSPVDDDFLTLGVSEDSATLQTYLDTISPADPAYTGIIIYPPIDVAYSIEINGLFYDSKLTVDTSANYWSTEYPNLLIMAACRELSIMYKGAKTAKDWDVEISSQLIDIEKDFIDQEGAGIQEMNG